MNLEIVDKETHSKGEIYKVKFKEEIIRILILSHASERISKWGLKEEMVVETLIMPEEVLLGHRNRFIAHKRYDNHLVRAVYEYEGEVPILLTVYFPFADRYFKGGYIYEDKIFKGR